jgi:hypothetical protein
MYYLVFLVPLLMHPLKIDNRIKGILNSAALGLLAIFRFGAGSDYFSYSYLYYLSPKSSIIDSFFTMTEVEIGFKFLMFPFRFLNLPYEAFVGFVAIVIMTLMYFWIQKNAKSVSYAYLIYYSFFFIVWNLSALRQGLVITIGCFLLFNQQFKWRFLTKLIIIGLLCMLHISALFYLVFLLADQLKWDKKKLTFVVIASLVVSLLPIGDIALVLAKIPFFSRIAPYLYSSAGSIGFWDIKSLPRLFLIGLVLYHYDPLMKKGELSAFVMNSYIIGISFFFFLRFDNLIGARFSIYGFFLAVLILPAILDLYDKRKWAKIVASAGFIAMCALYLQKELSTMASQAGIKTKGYYVPYISAFQEKSVKFTNKYYYANNYSSFLDSPACIVEIIKFGENLEVKASTIKDDSKYIAVKFPNGKYGLIDTEGHVVLDGRFDFLEYYGGIIRVSSSEYYNVQALPMNSQKAAMIFFTAKAQSEKYIETDLTWFNIGRLSLSVELTDEFEKEGQFKFLNVVNQVKPLNFYIMEFLSNRYGSIYQLYNSELVLLSPEYFLDAKKILVNRVVAAENVCGTKFYNESGELIWMQLK